LIRKSFGFLQQFRPRLPSKFIKSAKMNLHFFLCHQCWFWTRWKSCKKTHVKNVINKKV